jgi:uncharacterized membrane protein YkvA (DUF1232 family)
MKDKKNTINFFAKVFIYIRALFDKRTPLVPKIIGAAIVIYILQPFDIIRDAVPLIGLLDDTGVAALGLFIISKLIPKDILDEYRAKEEK